MMMTLDLQLQILSLEYCIAATQQRMEENGELLEDSLREYLEMLNDIEELVSERQLLKEGENEGLR